MNRRELINEIAERTDTDKKAVDEYLQHFVQVITEQMSKGGKVAIPGFCKFARVDRKARWGRNPQTGEPVRIKASRRARITALKALKEATNTGKAPKAPAKIVKKAAKTATKSAKRATTKKKTAKRAPARKTAKRKTAKRAPAKRKTAARRKTTARRKTSRR